MDLHALKFPIGEHTLVGAPTEENIKAWIDDIEAFPSRLAALVANASVEQLNWRYRPDGWCVKQVIHHCADSHINSYTRFKLALTEDEPTIKPYFEDRWAELPDASDDDISASMSLLAGLHSRWARMLRTLSQDDLKKVFQHPEHGKGISLLENTSFYAWHSNHHLEHVRIGMESKGKYN